MNETVKNKPH